MASTPSVDKEQKSTEEQYKQKKIEIIETVEKVHGRDVANEIRNAFGFKKKPMEDK